MDAGVIESKPPSSRRTDCITGYTARLCLGSSTFGDFSSVVWITCGDGLDTDKHDKKPPQGRLFVLNIPRWRHFRVIG